MSKYRYALYYNTHTHIKSITVHVYRLMYACNKITVRDYTLTGYLGHILHVKAHHTCTVTAAL